MDDDVVDGNENFYRGKYFCDDAKRDNDENIFLKVWVKNFEELVNHFLWEGYDRWVCRMVRCEIVNGIK